MTRTSKTKAATPSATPTKAEPAKTSRTATKAAAAPPPPPPVASPSAPPAWPNRPGGKLGVLVELLRRPQGASVHDMAEATGWQIHSVRGAMAGSLRHRGFTITSDKPGELRIYRIEPPPTAKRGRPAKAK